MLSYYNDFPFISVNVNGADYDFRDEFLKCEEGCLQVKIDDKKLSQTDTQENRIASFPYFDAVFLDVKPNLESKDNVLSSFVNEFSRFSQYCVQSVLLKCVDGALNKVLTNLFVLAENTSFKFKYFTLCIEYNEDINGARWVTKVGAWLKIIKSHFKTYKTLKYFNLIFLKNTTGNLILDVSKNKLIPIFVVNDEQKFERSECFQNIAPYCHNFCPTMFKCNKEVNYDFDLLRGAPYLLADKKLHLPSQKGLIAKYNNFLDESYNSTRYHVLTLVGSQVLHKDVAKIIVDDYLGYRELEMISSSSESCNII